MTMYTEGYFERGEGSNYHSYGDDPRWVEILDIMGNDHKQMLDVGAAKGWFVHHARERGHQAFGMDVSEYAVEKAAPLAVGCLDVADATKGIPYATHAFDAVCSWEFFEHIKREEVLKVLNEMVRVLKPDGVLWLRIALADGASAETDVDVTHVTIMPRVWWESLIAETQPDLIPNFDAEQLLDAQFAETDWSGRFFVYRKAK